MALYESDHTKFMREMLEKHPEWLEDQRQGRALWWDKELPQDEQQGFAAAKVAQKAYPYDVNGK